MPTNLEVMEILRREIDISSIHTVLDLGCGSFFNSPFDYKIQDILLNIFGKKEITGLDIYRPNIDWRNKYGPKGVYIEINILKYEFDTKYDVIMCHHVLEHLTEEEHDIILTKIESSFKKYSIIGGPIGYHDNSHHVNQTGNSYEKHQMGLDPFVYEKMGYKIFHINPIFVAVKERK